MWIEGSPKISDLLLYLALEKRFKHTCERSEHHINEYTINEKQTNISKIKLDKKKGRLI